MKKFKDKVEKDCDNNEKHYKKINLPKLNMGNKKTNIIVTAVIAVIALVCLIVSAVQFNSFKHYDTQFYTGGVDEFETYSDYSPLLKGTAGDAPIYKIYGDKNTVAIVNKDRASDFDTVEKINASDAHIVTSVDVSQINGGVRFDELFKITKPMDTIATATEAFEAVKNGTYDIAVVEYADYRAVKQNEPTLTMAKAKIELVPSILMMGGTHPNEPASQVAITLFLENIKVERGIVFIVNEVNRSAFTHSQPQEASAWYFDFTTPSGQKRTFKFGSRSTNTTDQWPTPDVYTHSSGQQLSSSEVRNINRSYPGAVDGTYTERLSHAITQLVVKNDITMVVDTHEASPEYITINAIVAHQDALDLATNAKMWELDGILNIGLESSPMNLHGLTHRDLGDYSHAYVCLCETSNASQGKIRGKFTKDLITYDEKDKFYEYARQHDEADNDVSNNILFAHPVHINERVARHTATIKALVNAFNDVSGNNCMSRTAKVCKIGPREGQYLGQLTFTGVPSYEEVIENGVGNYLHDLDK